MIHLSCPKCENHMVTLQDETVIPQEGVEETFNPHAPCACTKCFHKSIIAEFMEIKVRKSSNRVAMTLSMQVIDRTPEDIELRMSRWLETKRRITKALNASGIEVECYHLFDDED